MERVGLIAMEFKINKSKENFQVLNKLVELNQYTGNIFVEKFELARNTFLNNFRIIGDSKEHRDKFIIRCDFKFPMNLAFKVLLFLTALSILFSLINAQFILALSIVLITLIFLLVRNIKSNKEKMLFSNRFYELKHKFK